MTKLLHHCRVSEHQSSQKAVVQVEVVWPSFHFTSWYILHLQLARSGEVHFYFITAFSTLFQFPRPHAQGFVCVIFVWVIHRTFPPSSVPFLLCSFALSQWPCTENHPFTISQSSHARAAVRPRRVGARRPCWMVAKRWVITSRHNHGDVASESPPTTTTTCRPEDTWDFQLIYTIWPVSTNKPERQTCL